MGRETAVNAKRDALGLFERQVARTEGEIATLAGSREQLREVGRESGAFAQEQADFDLLGRGFSKWGIPALIVQNVLAHLEVEVNELLALYEGGLALRFEGEKKTKTKDGRRESLEIMVFDGSAWRPFETFSGGERYRVASAMRLGLALLLASRSGARVETLILDEPEGLDLEGRQHLVAILERMSQTFGLVLVLSHYVDLQEALPSQIRVSRGEDGLSRAEVAA